MMYKTDVYIGVLLPDPPFVHTSTICGSKMLNWPPEFPTVAGQCRYGAWPGAVVGPSANYRGCNSPHMAQKQICLVISNLYRCKYKISKVPFCVMAGDSGGQFSILRPQILSFCGNGGSGSKTHT